MNYLAENINKIKEELAATDAKLVAVTKTKPAETLLQAYQAGLRVFGENKVQEMTNKYEALPKDIEWHLIGHLQTNKVKYIAPFVKLIHSIDSLKLLKEVNKEAVKNKRVINCLLQVYIADEDTKFGLSEEELLALLKDNSFTEFKNIKIKGLMGMATNTEDETKIRAEFRKLKQLFEQVKVQFTGENMDLQEVSMGMSGDYKIAIEEGSTLVRIGSLLFGNR